MDQGGAEEAVGDHHPTALEVQASVAMVSFCSGSDCLWPLSLFNIYVAM